MTKHMSVRKIAATTCATCGVLGFDLTSAFAANLPNGFSEFAITGPINSGTTLEFAPDGKLFVLEQAGTIKVYQGSGATAWTQVAPSSNFLSASPLAVDSSGERGLLGIAFHPNYLSNRWMFVYYTKPAPNTRNRIVRFTANAAGTQAIAGSRRTLMNLDLLTSANNHNGGAIHFGPDGKLYVAVGDNANGANAQSLNTRLGKILRLHPNPNNPIPSNNPTSFDGIAGTTTGLNRAIWAVGLRNPFTFAFRPGTSTMYINDVGQDTWEEVNDGFAGANYGWPATEGPFNQGAFPDFTHPIVHYHHTNGSFSFPPLAGFTGGAITGGAFYLPETVTFPAGYVGDYFFADINGDWIKRFDPVTNKVRNFASNAQSVVDLRVGSDGALYYLSRNSLGPGVGQVFRVQKD